MNTYDPTETKVLQKTQSSFAGRHDNFYFCTNANTIDRCQVIYWVMERKASKKENV